MSETHPETSTLGADKAKSRKGTRPLRTPALGKTMQNAVAGLLALSFLTGCGQADTAESAAGASKSSSPVITESSAPTTTPTSTPAAPTSSPSQSGTRAQPDPLYSTPAPTGTSRGYVPASEKGPAQNVPIPVVPEAAKVESEAGAWAYVEYLIRVSEYGMESRKDVTGMFNLTSSSSCTPCENLQKITQTEISEGYWTSRTKIKAKKLKIFAPDSKNAGWQVILHVEVSGSTVHPSSHKKNGKEKDVQGAETDQFVDLIFSNGQWKVSKWKNIGKN